MRCSGWSSRAIWASSVAAALVLAPSAWAHLSVTPTKVPAGRLVDLTFSAPNADDAAGIDRVTVTPPPGFALDDAEAKPGWTQSRAGGSVTWTGGNIPLREYATFGLRGTVPDRAGTIVFGVVVADRNGTSLVLLHHFHMRCGNAGRGCGGARRKGSRLAELHGPFLERSS